MTSVRKAVPLAVTLVSVIAAISAAPQIYPGNYFVPGYQYNPYYAGRAIPVVPVYNVTNSTYQIRGYDFAMGVPSPREKVLLHTTVFKRPGPWRAVATKEITFPPYGSRMRANITRIYATDKSPNGTGALVKLIRGGIGQPNVTLFFKSQKFQPINYELDIYGYPL